MTEVERELSDLISLDNSKATLEVLGRSVSIEYRRGDLFARIGVNSETDLSKAALTCAEWAKQRGWAVFV